jgi:hypothetical protein
LAGRGLPARFASLYQRRHRHQAAGRQQLHWTARPVRQLHVAVAAV